MQTIRKNCDDIDTASKMHTNTMTKYEKGDIMRRTNN